MRSHCDVASLRSALVRMRRAALSSQRTPSTWDAISLNRFVLISSTFVEAYLPLVTVRTIYFNIEHKVMHSTKCTSLFRCNHTEQLREYNHDGNDYAMKSIYIYTKYYVS